ncbi:adenosylcobinamide amidohydrolase [Paenibacillus aurantius]|uniref:Adenosylcobinamide amidohydrolase n=1 Tax=Paenibacillus aurantius TaxID=2918900 RepID=A0AA96LCG9_9BACL|nr:adenosylcobinamide amidohydrolase [Paenibacillus aurantius]WNQ09695.1 adenosylcobinamide amidohydrolase [Paenibacillus aurantius]
MGAGTMSGLCGIGSRIVEKGGESWLEVTSPEPLYVLNSSLWGGGFGWRTGLVNRQVDKSYSCDDPGAEMECFLTRNGYEPDRTAGLLTAARVQDGGYASASLQVEEGGRADRLEVRTWVTVGLSNKARAGLPQLEDNLFPGTINIIVLLDGQPTEAAMVNAVITATEAKAAVLQDLNIRLESGEGATGTTTDAVLIAATGGGRKLSYAGTATRLGYLIGRTVYEATKASALHYLRYIEERAGSGFRS